MFVCIILYNFSTLQKITLSIKREIVQSMLGFAEVLLVALENYSGFISIETPFNGGNNIKSVGFLNVSFCSYHFN